MFINNCLIILMLCGVKTTCLSQNNTEFFIGYSLLHDEFDEYAWKRINSLEKQVELITYTNRNLQSQIYNLKKDIKKLKNVQQSLLKSELELIELKGELQALKEGYIALSGENETLLAKILALEQRLSMALNLLEEYKKRIESQTKDIAEANLNTQAETTIAEARKGVITELINEEANENEVSFYNLYWGLRAGSSFSGLGMYTGLKIGYDQGIGLRSGLGYLPNQNATEGWFVNLGFDIYLNEHIYLSSSYLQIFQHYIGYFNHSYSFALGMDYTFRRHKGGGIKMAIGRSYLFNPGLNLEPKSIFSGDLGIFYKIQLGKKFRSL